MSELVERAFELARIRDRRHEHRWVLSRAHVQAFVDEENERRRKERERLADLPNLLPGFDPTEHLAHNQPCPPPDFDKANEMRLLGWPVRIADVDEMGLEPVRRLPLDRWEWADPWEDDEPVTAP